MVKQLSVDSQIKNEITMQKPSYDLQKSSLNTSQNSVKSLLKNFEKPSEYISPRSENKKEEEDQKGDDNTPLSFKARKAIFESEKEKELEKQKNTSSAGSNTTNSSTESNRSVRARKVAFEKSEEIQPKPKSTSNLIQQRLANFEIKKKINASS